MSRTGCYDIIIDELGFGNQLLLQKQQLRLQTGGFNVLYGPSGAGKTTLLHALSQYPDADRFSTIRIDSKIEFALLPQQPQYTFPPTRRVGRTLSDIAKASKTKLVAKDLLEEVGLSCEVRLLKQYPHECSGGELQRLALLACYLQDPDIILLDEPTVSLDPWNTELVIQSLRNWMEHKEERAVLCTTHEPSIFRGQVAHVYELRDGHLTKTEMPEKLIDNTLEAVSAHESLLYRVEKGKFRYSDTAFDLSCTIYKGETLGITGPSGSGKSTFAKLIAGWLKWEDSEHLEYHFDSHHGVQYIGQDPILLFHPFRKIGDQLQLVWQRWQHLHENSFKDFILQFQLELDLLDRPILQISGGQRQRVQLARTLMAQPQLVIFDENFSALDAELKAELIADITNYQKQYELTIVWISHDIDLLLATCDRLIVLNDGQIVSRVDSSQMSKKYLSTVTKGLLDTSI